MADWNKKYYFSFKDVEDVNYTVEIWEDIPDGSPLPVPALIHGDLNPVTLEYPGNYLFTPVRASGAILTLLSTSDRMFASLFTNDMMKYQVRIYKTVWITPIYSIEAPVWFGYLDSENYAEPFDSLTNYPVEVTANDGFNLLGRMNYVEYNSLLATYSHYTGLETKWTVLIRILQRLNLPWVNIYVGLSTTVDYAVLTDLNLFEKVYINNENWYNEDGEPETCRTILENILGIYGAFIVQIGGDLYITDYQHLSTGTTAVFKKYEYAYEATAFIDDVTLSVNNGDISTIGLQSSRINMSVESGINKQIVNYSPYDVKSVLDYNPTPDDLTGEGATTEMYSNDFWKYDETLLNNSAIWTKSNNGRFCRATGTGSENMDKVEHYLKIEPYNPDYTGGAGRLSFTLTSPLPYLVGSQTYFVKVTLKVFPQTRYNFGTRAAETDYAFDEKIVIVRLHATLKIGEVEMLTEFQVEEKYKLTPEHEFYPYLQDRDVQLTSFSSFTVGDVYKSERIPFLVPTVGQTGNMTLQIYDYLFISSPSFTTKVGAPCSLWIKQVGLYVTDVNGNEIAKADYEYTSKLDANFANEGRPVKTYLGTNVYSMPTQRGGLLSSETEFLTAVTRNGVESYPEKLLLRSIKSNYAEPNVRLDVQLPTQLNQIGYFTYSTYLSGKKLAILSNKINLSENVSQLSLREYHNDFANITD